MAVVGYGAGAVGGETEGGEEALRAGDEGLSQDSQGYAIGRR